MTATVAGIHLGIDTHANRPAGNAVPDGSLYSCSTHSLVYKSNLAGNSWATWATLGSVGGSVATDAIWTTSGKVAVATGTATATEQWPPGHEFSYVAFTAPVTITATTEAGADTVVTAGAVNFDGSTVVMIEFFSPNAQPGSASSLLYYLYDGASSIGRIGAQTSVSGQPYIPVICKERLTPSNASHTYSIRAAVGAGSGSVSAGAGGNGNVTPGYIRITKA